MAKKDAFYKCEICGNLVSVIEAAEPEPVCCGKPMTMLEEKGAEQEGKEKHVPVVEKTDKGVMVKVGSVAHPMEAEHYIELIQLVKDGEVLVEKRLKPGQEPSVQFCCLVNAEGVSVRALCNVHGLWKS